jgi:hypothetical protein
MEVLQFFSRGGYKKFINVNFEKGKRGRRKIIKKK